MPGGDRSNIVVFVSDEHAARFTGSYGHGTVETPSIDRLAADGARFDNAYCPSPLCVPARLSLFAGQYAHELGAWDLDVSFPSNVATWGDRLGDYETVLCGRTHAFDDTSYGFDRQLLDDHEHWKPTDDDAPVRDPPGPENSRDSRSHVTDCGIDEDHWQLSYDRTAADLASGFITDRDPDDPPFLLYVGTINPHFPLRAPERLVSRYAANVRPSFSHLNRAPTHDEPIEEQHPFIQHIRQWASNDTPLDREVEQQALASYYALVTFVDELVGQVRGSVDRAGLADDTVFVYTSDHGEMAGHHGHWQKQCMYDPAVRVPLVAAGPGVPDIDAETNTSLVDLTPTILDIAGQDHDSSGPGESLRSLARREIRVDQGSTDTVVDGRAVLSEYHAMGATAGVYMLAKGDYKYVHYVDHDPQLFDLDSDPNETENLAADPEYAEVRAALESELRGLLDPEAVDAEAKADQRRRRDGPADTGE